MKHFSNESSINQKRLSIGLLESAATTVIVIDERIQENIENRQSEIEHSNYTYSDELRWMKILIPSQKEVHLSSSQFDEKKISQLLEWLQEEFSKSRIDFLVIHLGILERICGSSTKQIEDFIDNNLRSLNEETEIILTSGRGSPHFIPSDVLFLHYSNIASYIIHEKSKFHLSKTLFSARTRHPSYEKIP